jgi:hypothetical protein
MTKIGKILHKKIWSKIAMYFFVGLHQDFQAPESIEWLIEDQAFMLSYDLAPSQTPPLSISVFLCVASRAY